MARKDAERVSAVAVVLSPMPNGGGLSPVRLVIELPDGAKVTAAPLWRCSWLRGVVVPGTVVPVTLPPGKPDETEAAEDHIPRDSDVAEVMAEALGGAVVPPRAPDEWRVRLALAYAERVIAVGNLSAAQADAIRQRIASGV